MKNHIISITEDGVEMDILLPLFFISAANIKKVLLYIKPTLIILTYMDKKFPSLPSTCFHFTDADEKKSEW